MDVDATISKFLSGETCCGHGNLMARHGRLTYHNRRAGHERVLLATRHPDGSITLHADAWRYPKITNRILRGMKYDMFLWKVRNTVVFIKYPPDELHLAAPTPPVPDRDE